MEILAHSIILLLIHNCSVGLVLHQPHDAPDFVIVQAEDEIQALGLALQQQETEVIEFHSNKGIPYAECKPEVSADNRD